MTGEPEEVSETSPPEADGSEPRLRRALHSLDRRTAIVFPRDLAGELHTRMTVGSAGSLQALRDDVLENEQDVNRIARFLDGRPLPSEASLARMLDVGYVASLLYEEGRRVRCALGYLSPQGASSLGLNTFRFSSPLPFAPATLAKLAPAAQPGRTELGVWIEDGELVVWGFIHHGDPDFALELEPIQPYFSTRIIRPGTLAAYFDERLLLLFARDHGQFFERGVNLLKDIRDRALMKPSVASALCRIARRMLVRGHGGTLLVVDSGMKASGLVPHPALTPASSPDRMLADAVLLDARARTGELRQDDEHLARYVARRVRIERAHDEALDFIARLAAVDGAVVLDSELNLLGAGVTIQTPRSATPKEVVIEDPARRGELVSVPLATLGGNRHRSAVCFCAQQPRGAFAMVASQDGDLSVVSRQSDGLVHVLRPYELGGGI